MAAFSSGSPDEREVAAAGGELALEGGQLRRLVAVDVLRLQVAGDHRGEGEHGGEQQRPGERAAGELLVTPAQQVVRRDAHDEERAHDERAQPDVDERRRQDSRLF